MVVLGLMILFVIFLAFTAQAQPGVFSCTPAVSTTSSAPSTTSTSQTSGGATVVSLTPSTGSTTTKIAFGPWREPRGVTVLLTSPSDAPAPSNLVLVASDLQREDGVAEIPESRISLAAETKGSGQSEIKVCIDPGGVAAGEYTGQIRVTGPGLEAYVQTLVVSLQRAPWLVEPSLGWIWAFLLILIGALFGTILKWLSETGAELSRLRRRMANLRQRVKALVYDLPPDVTAQLNLADSQIEQGDAIAAEKTIQSIEEKLPKISSLSAQASWVKEEIRHHETTVRATFRDDRDRFLQLHLVVRHENFASSRLWLDSWDKPEETLRLWNDLQSVVSAFTSFLASYAGKKPVSLTAAVGLLAEGKYPEAAETLRNLELGLEPQPARAADKNEARATSPATVPTSGSDWGTTSSSAAVNRPAGFITRLKNLVIEHQTEVTTALITLAVSLAGLQLLYFDNPTYGKDAGDALTLIGWGFAVQVTGATATQVGRHFSSGTPSIRADG
jgi:hypothetical protein